jgi:Leucine-rich repeat (LRR) protein
MWSWLWIVVTLLVHQHSDALKPPLCQAVYGIRMSSTGTIEKVLDAARCENADVVFIKSFLEQIKPQILGGNLLELEINNCSVPSLSGSDSLAGIGLRRLSIQQSGLNSLSIDSLAGQENFLEELDLSGNNLEEIPAAIRNLTALIRMDLSRNRIRSLPQGSVFFHLLKLRHLNMNYNRLGYLDTVRFPSGAAAGQTLPLAIFNLEPLRDHIETIQLRSNNLSAFPDQFARSFGRLRHLDLSYNNFQSTFIIKLKTIVMKCNYFDSF